MSGDKLGPQHNPVYAWQNEIDRFIGDSNGLVTAVTVVPSGELPTPQLNKARVVKCLAVGLAVTTLIGLVVGASEKEGKASVEYTDDDNFEATEEVLVATTEADDTFAEQEVITTTTVRPTTIAIAPAESEPETIGSENTEIIILGDDECEGDTEAALNLLRQKAPMYYELVTEQIDIIQCAEKGSGMYAFEVNPRFVVGNKTRTSNGMKGYAGAIVHDAVHAELYSQYEKENPGIRVPDDAWTGSEAERICLDVQIEALKAIGAPDNMIRQVDQSHDSEYWLVLDRGW